MCVLADTGFLSWLNVGFMTITVHCRSDDAQSLFAYIFFIKYGHIPTILCKHYAYGIFKDKNQMRVALFNSRLKTYTYLDWLLKHRSIVSISDF